MIDDESVLEYLASRGIEPGVVKVLRSLLAARPRRARAAAASSSIEQNVGAFKSSRNLRSSAQRDCVHHAISRLYPDGIPEDLLAPKLKREVQDEIERGKGEPWHIAVSKDTVSDHVDAFLGQRPKQQITALTTLTPPSR